MSSLARIALKDVRKASNASLKDILMARDLLLNEASLTPRLPFGPFVSRLSLTTGQLGQKRVAQWHSITPDVKLPPLPMPVAKPTLWQFIKGEFIEKPLPKKQPLPCVIELGDKLKPYSLAETKLSQLSERLAKHICQAFAHSLQGSSFAALIPFLSALEIRFDDPLFTAFNQIFALAQKLKGQKTVLLLCQDILLLQALAHLLTELNPKLKIYAPLSLDLEGLDLIQPLPTAQKPQFEDLEALKPAQIAASKSQTWIMGRPQDRNYVTDIHALLYEFPKASFFPTALREQQAAPFPNSHPFPEEMMRRFAPNKRREISDYWGENFVEKLLASLLPLEKALLLWQEKLLRGLCRKILPASLLALDYLHRAFERDRPQRIICLPSRDWLARAACLIGKAQGCVSFDVQTVFVGPRSRYKRSFATFQMAIETHSAKLYRDYFATPKEKVILAGGVRYGLTRRAIIQARLEGKRPNLKFKQCVLFAASPFFEACAPVVAALVEAVLPFEESGLILRLHPSAQSEQETLFDALLTPLGERACILHTPLAEMLATSDIVVTRFSNVGLEAALAYIPVIACSLNEERPPIPLDEMGVALRASTADNLQELIADFLFKKKAYVTLLHQRNSYLHKNPQLLNENPAFNLSQTILELS